MSRLTPALIDEYRRLSGAAVSNAIETFDLRLRNEGFADGSLRCLFRELPPVAGHAVTARIRCTAPPPVGHSYHDRTDWWNYIVSAPVPRIVVVQDVDDRPGFGAFVGEVHTNILRALGCVAYATNGSVRDVAAVRRLGFHLFTSGIAVSHGFAHIIDFGEPVQIAGLTVSSGDYLFGDSDGLLTLPPSVVDQIPAVARQLRTKEEKVIELCGSPGFSVQALRELVKDLE
jgi:4-hydroxy-4-methyl-2-oxoglutarate aldolase